MSITYTRRRRDSREFTTTGSGVTYTRATGTRGPNLITDATALGTLTDTTTPAFLLVGAAAGTFARKLTPTGWGLSSLLATVPAGRVPYADATGLVTSNAGLVFSTATGLTVGGTAVSGGLVDLPSVVNPWPIPTNQSGLRRFGTFTEVWNNNGFAANRAGACWIVGSGMQFGWSPQSTSGQQFGVTAEDTGLARDSAGTVRVSNGSTGVGSIITGNLTVRQPGGTAGTHQLEVNHDGFNAIYLNRWNANNTGHLFVSTDTNGFLGLRQGGLGGPNVFCAGGTGVGLRVASDRIIGWSSGTNSDLSTDTALSRNAAGVVEVNNGTAGQFRDLRVRNFVGDNSGYGYIGTIGIGYNTPGELVLPSFGRLATGSSGVNSPDVTLSRNAAGVWQMGTTAANALGSLLLTNLTASGEINTGSSYYATRTLRLGVPSNASPSIYVRNSIASSYFQNGTVACIAFRVNPNAATTPAGADLQFGTDNLGAAPRMVLNHNQIAGYTAIMNADTTVNGNLRASGTVQVGNAVTGLNVSHNGTDVTFLNPAGVPSTTSFMFGSAGSQAYVKAFGTITTTQDMNAFGNFRLLSFGGGIGAGGNHLTFQSGFTRCELPVRPMTSTDAAAPVNTLYYSSDAGKLVYKDAGGTVNPLY